MHWAFLFWLLVAVIWWFAYRCGTLTKDKLASAVWLTACSSFVAGVIIESVMRGGKLPIGW